MLGKNKRYILLLIPVLILIGYFIYDSYNQPSIKDLPGNFEEVAFVRNEQNKGGVIRIYAVTVGDLEHADFDACAALFPTNDYGSLTTVYFFDKKAPFPTTLKIDAPHYDSQKYQAISIVKRTGATE